MSTTVALMPWSASASAAFNDSDTITPQATMATSLPSRRTMPFPILIAHTVKGHGVSFMADNPAFHGAAPNDEQYAQAMAELGEVGA